MACCCPASLSSMYRKIVDLPNKELENISACPYKRNAATHRFSSTVRRFGTFAQTQQRHVRGSQGPSNTLPGFPEYICLQTAIVVTGIARLVRAIHASDRNGRERRRRSALHFKWTHGQGGADERDDGLREK